MNASAPGPGRVRRVALGLGLAAGLAGCASAGTPLPPRPAPTALPAAAPLYSPTLSDGDAWLRHHLMRGEHDAALHLLRRSAGRPRDALLRALQEGIVLHHAGRHAESNRVFARAEAEAERRYTKSVRRGVGALLVNDRVLAYSPSPAELAIVPYYRMLNYLALDRRESAVVEARKSSAHLARLADRVPDACPGFGLAHYLAGLVFAAAGELNDALVSLRWAERSFAACGGPSALPAELPADLLRVARALGVAEIADSVAGRYGLAEPEPRPALGELVVVLEHGFAAHRVQQELYVPIFDDEVRGLDAGDAGATLEMAGRIAARVTSALLAGPAAAEPLWERRVWRMHARPAPGSALGDVRDVEYVLRLAWPVMRLEAARAASVRLVVDGRPLDAPPLEDVSARLVRDLESRRAALLTRMVARGLIKYVVSREAGEKAEKEGGRALGALVRLFTNAAANALEQADTRSWSLLPDQISLVRLRLPPGEHHVQVELLDGGGRVRERLDLGRVEVQPGAPVFLSRRVWGPEPGDRERLMRLGQRVYAEQHADRR